MNRSGEPTEEARQFLNHAEQSGKSKQGWVLRESRPLLGRATYHKVFLVLWDRFLMYFEDMITSEPGATWDLGLVKQLWLQDTDVELHHIQKGKIVLRFKSNDEAREWLAVFQTALPQVQRVDAKELILKKGARRPEVVRLFSKWGHSKKELITDTTTVPRDQSKAVLEKFKRMGLTQVRLFISSLPERPEISEPSDDEELPTTLALRSDRSEANKKKKDKKSAKGASVKSAVSSRERKNRDEETVEYTLTENPPGPPPDERKKRKSVRAKHDDVSETGMKSSKGDKPTKSPKDKPDRSDYDNPEKSPE